MSLWGREIEFCSLLPLTLSQQLSTVTNKNYSNFMEILIGILDGDGYIEIGPQKQYNKKFITNPKQTIRIRIVLRLHKEDKELLEFIIDKLNIGKLDELKSVNQYRLIIYKTDIINIIYPYLHTNNLEFLTYNRRKQFFLLKYIIDNNIHYWEDLDLALDDSGSLLYLKVYNLFKISNKKLEFSEIINLPYFKNWLIGFTIAEGSFHIKSNGKAYYSIVQSGHENYHIIKAIHYFIKGSEYLSHQIKPENEKIYRISFSSKKDLLFIINFFENNKLLGLKKLQFDSWKSYIIGDNKINCSAPNVILSKVSNNNLLNNNNINNNESSNE